MAIESNLTFTVELLKIDEIRKGGRMTNIKKSVFCAFCKIEHSIYHQKHAKWDDFLYCFVISIAIMFLFWREFSPKFLALFLVCLVASEFFIQARWRVSIVCGSCGFDPVMYLKDPKKAEERVSNKLEEVKSSEILALSKKNPFRRITRKKRERGLITKKSHTENVDVGQSS